MEIVIVALNCAFDLQINTFQLVLITDSATTFVMMNYDSLTWPVYLDSTKGDPAKVSLNNLTAFGLKLTVEKFYLTIRVLKSLEMQ
jgi:Nidogen-like